MQLNWEWIADQPGRKPIQQNQDSRVVGQSEELLNESSNNSSF
jgi:hypothetical protein